MKIFLLAILLICCPFFVVGLLNLTSMCVAEVRWLSDEERIRLEVERIIERDSVYVGDENPEVKPNQYYSVVPYKSVEEFLEKNPECCNVRNGILTSEGLYKPALIDAMAGFTFIEVYGKYKIPYFANGKKYEKVFQNFDSNLNIQNNCGEGVNPW